jgi:glycosyltransferase involved in cell wall biosynthesis
VTKVDPGSSPGSVSEHPLRLTIFLADLGGGGAERMMVTIANGLAARGAVVQMLLARAVGPYLSEVTDDVEVIDLATKGVTGAIPGLVAHLRNTRPDVLLTTLSHTSAAALAARALAGTGTPVIVREANTPTASSRSWSSPKDRLARLVIHKAYRQADGVIAVSDGVASALREVVGVEERKIATLYNPVVSPELEALAAQDPDHPWFAAGGPPVVLGVGSLSKRKDFHTLIRAFDLVARQTPARLVILGEGPQRGSLEELITSLDLTDRVDMPGFKQNPFSFMARANVYVLSSHLEGLPGSLVQALACGCPSVATDCPSGPFEILQGGAIGPLVDIGDHEAMAAAVMSQLQDPPPTEKLVGAVVKYHADTVLASMYTYLATISSAQRQAASPQG